MHGQEIGRVVRLPGRPVHPRPWPKSQKQECSSGSSRGAELATTHAAGTVCGTRLRGRYVGRIDSTVSHNITTLTSKILVLEQQL